MSEEYITPMHDWTRVEAGIFHDFHHAWIEEIKRSLNQGLLPPDYYAMAEQHAAGFGPDVLTLQNLGHEDIAASAVDGSSNYQGVWLAEPQAQIAAETDRSYYRRKQKLIAVRHASGDRIVAVIEIVSEGNKSSKHAIDSFVNKAIQFLELDLHLLILDLHPPGRCAPDGIHGALWEEIAGENYHAPPGKPLALVSYRSSLSIRAFVEPVAVGDLLPSMRLFIEPQAHILVPLEQTYQSAFAAVPLRWRRVLENSAPS
jgi:hypothetical protein